MNDYEKQALDFLKKTNAKLEVKFKKFDKHFGTDDSKRNIWTVKLSRGSRVYKFDFGDSIANSESETTNKPTAYDILACLNKYEPADNVDDFALEFGYNKPSEALRVYKAVKEEWTAIKELFTDDEIELLNEVY